MSLILRVEEPAPLGLSALEKVGPDDVGPWLRGTELSFWSLSVFLLL